MEFDAFILNCSGLIDSDKQKDMVNDHMAARDEIDAVYDAIDQSVLNSLVNRYIAFSRVDHVGSGSPNEEEIMRLFGNIHSDFLMRAGEGEAAKTYRFYPFTANCLPQVPGTRLLDLGCGTGLELGYYFETVPSAVITESTLHRGC